MRITPPTSSSLSISFLNLVVCICLVGCSGEERPFEEEDKQTLPVTYQNLRSTYSWLAALDSLSALPDITPENQRAFLLSSAGPFNTENERVYYHIRLAQVSASDSARCDSLLNVVAEQRKTLEIPLTPIELGDLYLLEGKRLKGKGAPYIDWQRKLMSAEAAFKIYGDTLDQRLAQVYDQFARSFLYSYPVNLDSAEKYLEKWKAPADRHRKTGKWDYLYHYHSAYYYKERQEQKTARAHWNSVLSNALHQAVVDTVNLSNIEYGIGETYYQEKELRKALPHLMRSVQFHSGQHRLGNKAGHLMNCLNNLEEFERSDSIFHAAILNFDTSSYQGNRELAQLYKAKAYRHLLAGSRGDKPKQLELAIFYFNRTLECLTEDYRDIESDVYLGLASANAHLNQHLAAIEANEKHLCLLTDDANCNTQELLKSDVLPYRGSAYVNSVMHLAMIHYRASKYDSVPAFRNIAASLYEIVVRSLNQYMLYLPDDALIQVMSTFHDFASPAFSCAWDIYSETQQIDDLVWLIELMDLAKANAYSREVRRKVAIRDQLIPTSLAQELTVLRDSLVRSSAEGSRYLILQEKLLNVEASVGEEYPVYAKFVYENTDWNPARIIQLKNSLGDRIFVDYILTFEQINYLVVSSDTVLYFGFPRGRLFNEICQELIDHLDGTQSLSLDRYGTQSYFLYERLVGPVRTLFDAHQWIVQSDDLLHRIPLTALSQDSGKYDTWKAIPFALQHLEITTTLEYPTAASVEEKSAATDARVSIFSFSNKKTRHKKFRTRLGELSNAEKEIASVSSQFGNHVKIYAGKQATRQNFLEALRQSDVLHVITHARSDPENRMRGWLYLRDANNPALLDSISMQDLVEAEINCTKIGLSACETNQGKEIGGEGVFSFTRAVKINSDAKVLSNLWEVNDWFASQYMGNYYAQHSGLSPNKGLRELLDVSPSRYSDPALWGVTQVVE